MIKYKLVDDPKNPGKKKAEVIHSDMIDLDDIIAELPGGFAMKEKYKKIIDDFFTTAFDIAKKEGRTVNTPLIIIKPTGKLDKNGEHEVEVLPGDELQKALENVKAVRIDGDTEPDPVKINFVHDLLSGTTNKQLTPGGIVEINGKYLKLRPYNGKDEKECLYFESVGSGKRIYFENILTNTVHKIVAELPVDLPNEEGHLIIVTGMFDDPQKKRPNGKSKRLKVVSI